LPPYERANIPVPVAVIAPTAVTSTEPEPRFSASMPENALIDPLVITLTLPVDAAGRIAARTPYWPAARSPLATTVRSSAAECDSAWIASLPPVSAVTAPVVTEMAPPAPVSVTMMPWPPAELLAPEMSTVTLPEPLFVMFAASPVPPTNPARAADVDVARAARPADDCQAAASRLSTDFPL
jgi:hypothetical protein